VADFRDKSLQKIIKPISGVRALISYLQLELKIKPFNILNQDSKTIARGNFVLAKNLKKPLQKNACIFVKPIRGYSAEVKSLIKNFPVYEHHSDFDLGLLKIFEINIAAYSKPEFDFENHNSMTKAFYDILSKSFAIMQKNEPGIIADIDSEFLHDYRVSGRRMRSALNLINGIINPDKTVELVKSLKEIGKVSGPLRDLDVYLLREDIYKNLLPRTWNNKEIHAIFVTLKRRRDKAYTKMKTFLESDIYKTIISLWIDFFKNYTVYIVKDLPLIETAASLIIKHYKRVLKSGKKLSPRSLDEDFHKLRITCKKLRYLIEFFSSLFPQDKINTMLKHLKKLQDNLGDFNDLSVQIETLNDFLITAQKNNNHIIIKDVSALIAVLDYKKIQLRLEFYSLFKEFASAENKKLYDQLFNREKL